MSAPPDHALLEVGPGPAPPSGAVIQNTAKSLAPGRCLIEVGHGWHPLPLEWGLEGPCRAHVGMNVGWVEVRHVLWGLEHPQWEDWGNSEGGGASGGMCPFPALCPLHNPFSEKALCSSHDLLVLILFFDFWLPLERAESLWNESQLHHSLLCILRQTPYPSLGLGSTYRKWRQY